MTRILRPSPYFGSRIEQRKKKKEFPEVNWARFKRAKEKETQFKEDVCKHVRKRPPEVEQTGRESQEAGRGDPLGDCFTYKGHTDELVPPSANHWD